MSFLILDVMSFEGVDEREEGLQIMIQVVYAS